MMLKDQPALADDVLNGIAEAFGLSELNQRVVIDLEVGCIARIIRVDMLTEAQSKALIKSLKWCNAEVV
jgi:hypothetical protein